MVLAVAAPRYIFGLWNPVKELKEQEPGEAGEALGFGRGIR